MLDSNYIEANKTKTTNKSGRSWICKVLLPFKN